MSEVELKNSLTDVQNSWELFKQTRQKQETHKQHVDQLVSFYRQRLLPKEREILLEPATLLVEHLLVFLKQPSLSAQQKDALLLWLDSLLENIARLDQSIYNQLQTKIDQICEQFNSPQPPKDQMQDIEFKQTLTELIEESYGQTRQSKKHAAPSCGAQLSTFTQPTQTLSAQPSVAWQRRLFRLTAQALHPDKEADPAKKTKKVHLMQRLHAARKEGCVMTMIDLYCEHVVPQTSTVPEPEFASQLIALIHQKQTLLSQAYTAYCQESTLVNAARDTLYGLTPSSAENKVKSAIADFHEVRASLEYCRHRITDLDSLRGFLLLDKSAFV